MIFRPQANNAHDSTKFVEEDCESGVHHHKRKRPQSPTRAFQKESLRISLECITRTDQGTQGE